MSQVVYVSGKLRVEKRESGYCVVNDLGRIVQVYGSLDDAKKWFFGLGLNK